MVSICINEIYPIEKIAKEKSKFCQSGEFFSNLCFALNLPDFVIKTVKLILDLTHFCQLLIAYCNATNQEKSNAFNDSQIFINLSMVLYLKLHQLN